MIGDPNDTIIVFIVDSYLTSFFCSQHHGYVSQRPSDDLSIVGEL